MKCQKCQTANREGRKFCHQCGAKLVVVCAGCGYENLCGERFCGECGNDLKGPEKEARAIDYTEPHSYTPKHLAEKILTTRSSIEGERKLVTVLFADVANYTSMAEKLDPEEVHETMDGCFKILMDEIHRYEGTINQFIGDGVMAIFGAPVAHEEHAQRACHAALSIQSALEGYSESIERRFGCEFRMRIGLNSGPVVVGAIGDDLRMDYTAIGDTTNLAARLQSIAEPGTVLVSEQTQKLAKDFFDFETLGEIEVKGKSSAQQAHRLFKGKGVKTRIQAAAARGLTKFVGRSREMQALEEAYDKARSGCGQVVGIVGEAGVGKSRVLLELRNMLPRGEYAYYEGRCLHYGGTMAYLPVLDILRAYFDIKEDDRESAIRKKMEGKILDLDNRLVDHFPPFRELLSLKENDMKYLQLEPGEKKLRIFEAIRDLFLRESENRPLVLAVEDLHWIDRTTEELLGYLIGWLSGARILLILLYRPEYTHPWGSKSYYSRIGLDQLSPKTGAELVQAILEDGEVGPELRDLVLGRAGGNPLFVEELTHNLLENGSIQKRNHEYVLTRKRSEIQVPDTVQGIIAARIDRIEENLKRVIQIASVIGREFAFRILQRIMDMREGLKSSLLNLQGLEFISEKRLFPELEYIFKHAITQEVAYNSLLQRRRKEIHEKIGNAIESLYPERLEDFYELLAHHYGRSDNKSKALDYLELAAQKAARLSAMGEAKAYFDEAMGLLETLPYTEENRQRRLSLLVHHWLVFMMLLKFPEYYRLLKQYEPIASGSKDQRILGLFCSCMGLCEWWRGMLDQALQYTNRAIGLFEGIERTGDATAFAYFVLIYTHLFKGNLEKVLIYKEEALRVLEQEFNLRFFVWSLSGATWAYSMLGRWDEALAEGQKALKAAEEYSSNSLICFAAYMVSWALTSKGELDQAVEYANLAVEKAPTPADKAWAQMRGAWALCRAGQPERAVEIWKSVLPIYQTSQYAYGESLTMLCLGEAHWLIGNYHDARHSLLEGLRVAEECGMRYLLGWTHRLLGEVALKTNPAEAAMHFEKSISILQEIKGENELALAYSGYGRFHKQQGNTKQAREYLTNALGIFERLGTLIEPDKVRQELAELP